MTSAELLALICCPETHQPLAAAPPELIAAANQRIAAGAVKNRGGENVSQPVEGGFVRADQKYLYPIRNGLPVLLIDAAIPL